MMRWPIRRDALCRRAMRVPLENSVSSCGLVFCCGFLRSLDVDLDPLRLRFGYAGRSWHFDPATGSYAQDAARPAPARAVSPEGRRAISVRGHGLWVHGQGEGAEE